MALLGEAMNRLSGEYIAQGKATIFQALAKETITLPVAGELVELNLSYCLFLRVHRARISLFILQDKAII